jgi:hypothetical protein
MMSDEMGDSAASAEVVIFPPIKGLGNYRFHARHQIPH